MLHVCVLDKHPTYTEFIFSKLNAEQWKKWKWTSEH